MDRFVRGLLYTADSLTVDYDTLPTIQLTYTLGCIRRRPWQSSELILGQPIRSYRAESFIWKDKSLILKLNISSKSPRIEVSNDTFAEWKCCQVFAYESETFHRRWPNGISHCENGEQNPQNLPFPLHDLGPHLIQQCLGPPHAPPQTAVPMVEALSHTYTVKSHWLQWCAPNSPPKVPLPIDRFPNPTTCLIPGPVRSMMPNGIRIRSAVFPQWTGQTERPTDRSSTGQFDDYSPLRL